MSERITIGHASVSPPGFQRADKITAPLEFQDFEKQFPKTTIRWRKKEDSFVLEQWKLENPRGPTRGVWVEVPCVVDESKKQS